MVDSQDCEMQVLHSAMCIDFHGMKVCSFCSLMQQLCRNAPSHGVRMSMLPNMQPVHVSAQVKLSNVKHRRFAPGAAHFPLSHDSIHHIHTQLSQESC